MFHLTVSTGHASTEQNPDDCLRHLGRELRADLPGGPVSWSIHVDGQPGDHMGRVALGDRPGADEVIQEHLDDVWRFLTPRPFSEH